MTNWQLSRRSFHRLLIAGAGARSLLPLHTANATSVPSAADLDQLAAYFAHPPASAFPHTYWMWMNGNVTREGITLDLESMHRCGIGGAYIYNC
jgi:hypothetical protein